ncbi:MAG: polyhydroxyalkanoic acid system family protein [Sulfuritalea sp.]|nr:polyhydroxyalkanoic acid system family protein [Sulfuritalea sp.]
MSEIRVVRTHGVTLKRARKGAEQIAEELGEEFGLDHEWDGDTLRFQRMGVAGHIEVGKKEVEIYVKLGFLLMALGPRIEHEINRFCDEHFGPEA